MARETNTRRRGDCLAPTDPRFLDRPLDFIAEDHLREREVCAMLDRIAQSVPPNDTTLETVVHFLREELPRHLQDEEQDLFPLLQKRCEPEDEIDKVILRLTSDHRHSNADTPAVIVILDLLRRTAQALTDAQRDTLSAYASHARRHLILENAIVLPLARKRLTKPDHRRLTKQMSQRRGLGA